MFPSPAFVLSVFFFLFLHYILFYSLAFTLFSHRTIYYLPCLRSRQTLYFILMKPNRFCVFNDKSKSLFFFLNFNTNWKFEVCPEARALAENNSSSPICCCFFSFTEDIKLLSSEKNMILLGRNHAHEQFARGRGLGLRFACIMYWFVWLTKLEVQFIYFTNKLFAAMLLN